MEAFISNVNLWTSVLFVYWPGFMLGFLHSCVPCQDKTLFIFYTFGVSRQTKDAFRILGSYSSGLLISNIALGSLVTIVGSLLLKHLPPLVSSQIGALAMVAMGLYLLIQLYRRKFRPHSCYNSKFVKKIQGNNKNRIHTGFLVGIIAGFTPCLYEIAIFLYAAGIGIGNGMILVSLYALGILIGIFPYAIFGVNRNKKRHLSRSRSYGEPSISKIEIASMILLLLVGIILFSFAHAGVDLFSSVYPQI
ncbi:MAG: sulfite exporter TauE/SafE family protein [Candidatus Lokiarchaeota archaeon]|nr:sulfite exporter TauE/SafE family protein [Candidatus Lokiarchaeota archaeon]